MQVEPSPSVPQSNVGTDRVEMTIPARAEYVAVIRLVTAGIAGRMSFSFDDIEDLKIAVGEVCTAAVLAGGPAVQLRFDIGGDELKIRVAHGGKARRDRSQEGELGRFLVRCLVDRVRTETDGPWHVTWLTKRLRT
jgi:serine/threonine-protein kinase RsbW